MPDSAWYMRYQSYNNGYLNSWIGLLCYDNYTYYSALSANWATYTRSYARGIKTISLYCAATDYVYIDLDTFQLEIGSVASDYEKYKESTSYIEPKPMRRLPNEVCDSIDLATGKRTINVKEITLQSSDIDSIGSLNNIDFVRIKKPTDYAFYNALPSTFGTFKIEGPKKWPRYLTTRQI